MMLFWGKNHEITKIVKKKKENTDLCSINKSKIIILKRI